MEYALLKEITQDDIDFVYNLKIEFELTHSHCTIGVNSYLWGTAFHPVRVVPKVDTFILKNPTPKQLTLLHLKYSDSLVSINQWVNQG